MRVLLTGFGPFPGAPSNPSAAVAKALARKRRPALAGIARAVHVFATSYAAVDRDLPGLIAARPDIVLMFGLAARTRHLRIETRARNARSVLFPDVDGRRARYGAIAPGGPASLRGGAPFARLLGTLRPGVVPARLSRDAGRYLCNYAYWQALQRSRGGHPVVQFIHIPSVRSTPRPRRRSRRHPPTLGSLIAAGEAILIALIAASRR